MGNRNVFWYSDPEFPKMGFRGTGSIKKVPNGNGGGDASTTGVEEAFHSFRNWGWRGVRPGLFGNHVQEKGVHSDSQHAPMKGGERDRVELSGTQEERKKNYPVGE
ncbi:hypothetical protein CDAR_620261 [Caerostris darwini]|uniref:Uncharacterized protein n=1 Tax=Caerostris darwini TaxID=1538125 RepID=A0AAV4VL98_9ARAC|nr:hypothetical protein CDAR_620261 [Caerostris darwini]